MGADLLEGARERFDVCVGEVLREVSFDSVSVVAAGALQRLGALFGEDDEDRAAVVFGADAADETLSSIRSTTRVKPLLL